MYSDSIVQSIEIDSGWSLYVFGEVFFSLVKLRVSQRIIACLPRLGNWAKHGQTSHPGSLVAWKPQVRSQGCFSMMLQVSPMLKKVNELMQYISNFDGRPDHESPTQLWITICFWVVLYMSIMWLAYWMLKAPWSGMKEKAMPQHTMRWLGCGMQHFTHLKSGENTIITRQMVQTDNAAC